MSSTPKHVPLPKSERHVVSGAVAIGPAAPDEVIEVTVNVRRRHPLPSVDSMATQLPSQRKYLTRKQFEHTYGADQKDLDLVAAFAKEYGLHVMESSVAKRQVRLKGTVQAFSKAFLVTLERYQHAGGTYRGRKGTLSIPENLAGVVVGVFGLDNRRMARNYLRRPRAVAKAGPKTFTPPQVAQLYDYPTIGSGTNQCIGILEFGGGFTNSDTQTFFSGLKLPVPTIVAVPVGNGSNDPGADTDADGEVALDIQVAGSIAPQARLAVYFSEFTEQGWVDAVSTAVNDDQNKPSVLSISWGFSEFGKIPNQLEWTQQAMDAVDESFQAAAVMGVTICCAAGDDGSADQENDGLAHVDFPSSSPNVLACGGTRLEGSNGQITSEVVWNELKSGNGATGGGVSVAFPVVPPFQASLNPPPTSANPGHKTGRGVPDLAANADPLTGFNIIVGGQPQTIGGTSAVAPLVAGLIALINQQLPHPVGFINALLYQNPTAFRDITSGNNGAYKAGPGWDACTGLGSPNGKKLLQALEG